VVKQCASSSKSVISKLLLLTALLAVENNLFSQKYFSGRHEVGIIAGGSNYHGDLSHGFNFENTRAGLGAFYKYNLSSYFCWRNQLQFMGAAGTDKGVAGYGNRNLSFQTDIWDISSTFEFNFQPFGTNVNDLYWTPYFYSGLTAFVFDPTRLENEDIRLRGLRTENQKKPYSRLQPAIPIGFGLKKMLKPQKNRGVWIVSVEGCWRKTFTDYLDDVSGVYPDYKALVDSRGLGTAEYSHPEVLLGNQPLPAGTMRGDTHLKDWYYFIGFTASYRFTPLICR
jgi:hypothetical protein